MGACVSSYHNSSAMNIKSNMSSASNPKPDKHLVIPPSPIKEKPPIVNGNVAVKPLWSPLHSIANSRDFGSQDEKFYDSQAWLESDCEDEFMSVNGEFTPSRGNTPVNHKFQATTPPIQGGSGTPSVDEQEPSVTPSGTPPSPSKKKKRLSELFKESLRDNHEEHENGEVGSLEHESLRGGLKPKRERWVETVHMHSCLPRMLSSCRPATPQQTEVRRK